VVNAVLGCVGVIPLGLVWAFLANHCLAGPGITHRDPTDNDGSLPDAVVATVALVAYVAVWCGVNVTMSKAARSRSGLYWSVSVLVALLSIAVVTVFPRLWTALEQK
jgi:hypothetical protein